MGKSSKNAPITKRSFFVNGTEAAESRKEHPAGKQKKYGIRLHSGQGLTPEQAKCLGVSSSAMVIDLTKKGSRDRNKITQRLYEWGIRFIEGELE